MPLPSRFDGWKKGDFNGRFKNCKGLQQGIQQTKAFADINHTDGRYESGQCSRLKQKHSRLQCALPPMPARSMLALGLGSAGTVLAKCVVQHSLRSKPEKPGKRL